MCIESYVPVHFRGIVTDKRYICLSPENTIDKRMIWEVSDGFVCVGPVCNDNDKVI